ncbi:hypothetical protein DFJ63DRAFT_93855 [Scheffersomyces coipomensis]|uniref:uncharacterized protein n=1 Tax=Scheffersomyces coipomensis TaxID=1788519 RepID=UPI00315D1044
MTTEKKIVVLGAGVIGLTSALLLKKWDSNYDITVVGAHLPGDIDIDYTSPFAGANWHSFADADDLRLQNFDKPGYYKLIELAENEPKSGIWVKDNISYVTDIQFKSQGSNPVSFLPWFKDFVHEFKILDKSELPDGIAFGYKFKGVIISVPIYLNYLLQENLSIGNKVHRIAKIKNINEVRHYHSSGLKADFVINCTGLLANTISGFKETKRNFPVRGQVLHVRNHAKNEVSVEGFPNLNNEMLYLMPRKEGGCIIGGCFLQEFANTKVDEALTKRIIERAIKYVPELIDPNYKNNPTSIDIIRTNVGLRPFRESGARVEIDEDNDWLIHNYGAGGGGYQGSYGMCREVVRLLYEILRQEDSLTKHKL